MRIVSAFVLVVVIQAPHLAAGENGPLTSAMLEYERLVVENNPSLAELEEQLGEARREQARVLPVSDSSFTATGSYAYTPGAPTGPHGVSGTGSFTVPVLPQISLNGQISTAGNASASLVLTPLSGISASLSAAQQVDTLTVRTAFKRLQLQWESRLALLRYAVAKRKLAVRERSIELERRSYDHAEGRYSAGYLSAEELRDSADSLSAAAASHISAAQAGASAEKLLYGLSGLLELPVSLSAVDVDRAELERLIGETVAVYTDITESGEVTSEDRELMLIEESFLERLLARTWAIEPGVTVTVSGSVSDGFGTPAASAGAGVSLQISADTFNFDERRELKRQIADVERDLALNRIGLQIDLRNALLGLDSAGLSAEASLRALGAAEEALEHAARDLEDGTISEYEYEELELSRDLAEVSRLDALVSVYETLAQLLQMFRPTPDPKERT